MSKEFECGVSYVGVTRVKSLENLAFVKTCPFKPRWSSIFTMNLFKMRLEQDKKEKESNDKYFPKQQKVNKLKLGKNKKIKVNY